MAGAWYEVGRALRALILGSRNKDSTGRATLKASSTHQPVQDPQASPGQYGEGRTRDLEVAEFRKIRLEYSPHPDGDPDPGEVVWTWVPYVENDGRGKDRPVLIIGRIDASTVVGCYLSTKQHRDFIPIGSGSWDSQGRQSFLSPERLLRVTHSGMRRESAQVDRQGFERAVAGIRAYYGLA